MENKLTNTELEALRHIRNFLIHNNRLPSIRELMKALGYKSPRSASIILENLISKGLLKKKKDGGLQLIETEEIIKKSDHAETVDIPLLGEVSCGLPLFAEENIEAYIPVSIKLAKSGNKYFLLRANGDSMNKKGINHKDLVLIKQQNYANNEEMVVALIDNEATIKEFHKRDNIIVLKPQSTNKKHQPIILTEDFKIQGIVIATIPL